MLAVVATVAVLALIVCPFLGSPTPDSVWDVAGCVALMVLLLGCLPYWVAPLAVLPTRTVTWDGDSLVVHTLQGRGASIWRVCAGSGRARSGGTTWTWSWSGCRGQMYPASG